MLDALFPEPHGVLMMDDLFGHVPQTSSLAQEMASAPQIEYTPVTIRKMMLDVLAEARAARTLPWPPRKLRSHTAMFPYMAEWLPDGEGGRMMEEFKAELDRLEAPADHVAPNWRRIWGLAA